MQIQEVPLSIINVLTEIADHEIHLSSANDWTEASAEMCRLGAEAPRRKLRIEVVFGEGLSGRICFSTPFRPDATGRAFFLGADGLYSGYGQVDQAFLSNLSLQATGSAVPVMAGADMDIPDPSPRERMAYARRILEFCALPSSASATRRR